MNRRALVTADATPHGEEGRDRAGGARALAGSALYTGTIRHRRSAPVVNEFRYGVYYALLDLDEIATLAKRIPFFSHNRLNLTAFFDRDHMGRKDLPVREKLAAWLSERGLELGEGPVLLLTNLRVLGYVFNPVSYYYCLDAARNLRFVVAEVNNTFGETYCYLLEDLRSIGGRALLAPRRKVFHVSPFIQIEDVRYDWIVTPPGESLTVHIDEFQAGEKFFDATLNLKRQPLTAGRLAAVMIRYPHLTGRTIYLIHWQALKLWWKGVPYFRKPEPSERAWRTDG